MVFLRQKRSPAAGLQTASRDQACALAACSWALWARRDFPVLFVSRSDGPCLFYWRADGLIRLGIQAWAVLLYLVEALGARIQALKVLSSFPSSSDFTNSSKQRRPTIRTRQARTRSTPTSTRLLLQHILAPKPRADAKPRPEPETLRIE